MLFLMVGCVFTGCCAVAWEGRQIRMDVVLVILPPRLREFINVLSELVMIAAAAAVTAFAWPVITQLAAFDQRSQAANFPLLHSAGDGSDRLQFDGTNGRDASSRCDHKRGSGNRAVGSHSGDRGHGHVVSSVCRWRFLSLGFPIFLILLVTSIIAVLTVADVPTEVIQTYMFGSLDNFPLLAVPFFVLAGEIMAQGEIARRIIAMVMRDGWRRSRLACRDYGGSLRAVRRDVAYRSRYRGRNGPNDLSRAQSGRLQ